MSEYSVEEVRARFEAWVSVQTWFKATIGLKPSRNGDEFADPCINSRWQGWQAACEGVVPTFSRSDVSKWRDDAFENAAMIVDHYAKHFPEVTMAADDIRALIANPPAQAAQVAALSDPLGCNDCTHPDCGRYNGPRSVECRAMLNNACARPAGNQPYRDPTAEPVAQGEVVARLDDSGRVDFERWARRNWSLEVDRDTSGNYNDREARAAWASWREALRLAAQPRAVPAEIVVPDWTPGDVRDEADELDEEYDLVAITMLRDFADLLDRLAAAPSPVETNTTAPEPDRG